MGKVKINEVLERAKESQQRDRNANRHGAHGHRDNRGRNGGSGFPRGKAAEPATSSVQEAPKFRSAEEAFDNLLGCRRGDKAAELKWIERVEPCIGLNYKEPKEVSVSTLSDGRTVSGVSLLMIAAERLYPNAVEFLIKNNVNVADTDSRGKKASDYVQDALKQVYRNGMEWRNGSRIVNMLHTQPVEKPKDETEGTKGARLNREITDLITQAPLGKRGMDEFERNVIELLNAGGNPNLMISGMPLIRWAYDYAKSSSLAYAIRAHGEYKETGAAKEFFNRLLSEYLEVSLRQRGTGVEATDIGWWMKNKEPKIIELLKLGASPFMWHPDVGHKLSEEKCYSVQMFAKKFGMENLQRYLKENKLEEPAPELLELANLMDKMDKDEGERHKQANIMMCDRLANEIARGMKCRKFEDVLLVRFFSTGLCIGDYIHAFVGM